MAPRPDLFQLRPGRGNVQGHSASTAWIFMGGGGRERGRGGSGGAALSRRVSLVEKRGEEGRCCF